MRDRWGLARGCERVGGKEGRARANHESGERIRRLMRVGHFFRFPATLACGGEIIPVNRFILAIR
jgi:hypothetical protein